MAEGRVLLPTTVQPVHYNVHLKPDLEAFTFEGTLEVQVTVRESTDRVTIHALEISFDAAAVHVCNAEGKRVDAVDVAFDEKAQTVTISLGSALSEGEWQFRITSFQGILNDQMAGFYRSKYTVDGEECIMATTQFEPTDARRAFPCWDEPALKATFQVTLTVPTHLTALGNMPPEEEKAEGASKTIKFARTPIMSTYLVAFLVGEFDHVEDRTKEGVVMRVYTPLGKAEQGRFALDVAVKTLSYYTEYFGIAYPLPKQDMVAIADFSAGAMENWGLITYRETALLIDPVASGISYKQRVAYVVAHELAHQWFGNLVTMQWWKELWLNEGFATWVGNLAVDHLFPEWDIWTKFSSDYSARAHGLDGMLTSHPIEVEVSSSDEINEIFDAISYCKGAAVIRMVAEYVGHEAFRKGLNIYLNRFQYSNAVTTDLWAALQEASGLNVSEFMGNWTQKVGYPVLTVERTADKLNVSQKRFVSSGAADSDETVWNVSIPLSASHDPAKIVQVPLTSKSASLDLPEGFGAAQWIKVNAGQYGFFRAAYDATSLQALIGAIERGELPAIDRLGLQNDVFALAKAGLVATSQALRTASAFSKEEEYTVWQDLRQSIGMVVHVWQGDDDVYPKLQQYCRDLFAPLTARLGWDPVEGESDLTTLLRTLSIESSGSFEDENVIAEAKRRFANPDAIPADLRYIVYKLNVAHGGAEAFEQVKKRYLESELHQEKLRALRALGATKDEALIKEVLDMTFSEAVRLQDAFYAVAAAASSKKGRDLAWQYLQDNYDTFLAKFKGSSFLFGRIISSIASGFVSFKKAEEIEEFFKSHEAPGAERSVEQTLERIRANTAWLERDRDDVRSFFEV